MRSSVFLPLEDWKGEWREPFHDWAKFIAKLTIFLKLLHTCREAGICGMAPRQSLSRGTAKKVVKNFASKAVKNVLDSLIESKIKATPQNQKTVGQLICFYRHICASSVVKRLHWLDPLTALEVDIENEVKCTKEGLGGIKSCIHSKGYFFFTAIYCNYPQMRSRCESLFLLQRCWLKTCELK